ncbi:MAG: PAS domain S-box protein [Leptolyngbyaceae cyanobacterium]
MVNSLRLFSSDVWQSRLSQRIALWIFLSIVAIEAIILVPSVLRRERELLTYIKSLSTAQATGALSTQDLEQAPSEELLTRLSTIQGNEVVLGGALYTIEGELIGTFGEAPELALSALNQRQEHYNRRTQRYDAVWKMSPLEGRYQLIVRLDATWVGREFYAFIGRSAGLVMIISVFVTGATMVVLERLVISPILALRRDLMRAGDTIRQQKEALSLPFESRLQETRQDELGDVVVTFEAMVGQVSAAIAEREQAETELRFSEEKFSKTFYDSPHPMLLSTIEDGTLLEVNDSFSRFYGAPCEQVVGHTVVDLNLWVRASDRAKMLNMMNQYGFVRDQEYCFQTSQGKTRTMLFSAETLQINGRQCLLSVVNDITERKAAEKALQESEQRFRTLVEQATDALFVVDGKGRFLDVNQQACLTLGYSRDELLTLTVTDVQKSVSLEALAQVRAQVNGSPITQEGIHARKDGSTFPVEVRIGRIDIQGQPVLLALARDITERKQAESARARLAEIGELAAMIVHEVRNPLTTILMGLHSFASMDLPERAQMRLTFALDESERLQRLLNEILLYARDQALDLTPIKLNQCLKDLVEGFKAQPMATERHIQSVGLDTPVTIAGDLDKLKQVFINLLSNACEAVPEGETVTCSLDRSSTNQIAIKVHNGGAPIPPDVLPKLMQPFFTTKSTGNGLGLAITRRIVEAHQGTLQIESSAETGTLVTVSLPAIAIKT